MSERVALHQKLDMKVCHRRSGLAQRDDTFI